MPQPPYQPATPQEAPIPKGGRVERFNEQDSEDSGDVVHCPQCEGYASIDLGTGDIYCPECHYKGNELDEPKTVEEEAEGHCDSCGGWGDCRWYEPRSEMLCKRCRDEARRIDKINRSEEEIGSGTDPEHFLGHQEEDWPEVESQSGEKMVQCPDCGATVADKKRRKHVQDRHPSSYYKEEEPTDEDVAYLQWQIDNLDTAHEKLQNDVAFGRSPWQEEPDPSNPTRELDPDPDIPEPVDEEKDIEKEKEPFGGEPVTAEGLDVPDKIEIPERLFNDLQMMIEYSITNDNEAGGFLIIAEHGQLGVVGEQFGKSREIVLEPNEQLHKGEMLIGTVHMHPITPTASTGDVSGYLNDENEKVMVVVGADKSINIFFKTAFTSEGDYGDEISENFEQGDMDMLCEGLGFIWYRAEESDRTVASIITHVVDDVELNIVDETWPIEELVKGLGIKGRPDIPEEYSTKKTPLRLQVPFALHCNEKRLIG